MPRTIPERDHQQPIAVGVAAKVAGRAGSAASSIGARTRSSGLDWRKQLRRWRPQYSRLKRCDEATLPSPQS